MDIFVPKIDKAAEKAAEPEVIWDPHAEPPKPTRLDLKNPAFTVWPEELIQLRIEAGKHPPLLQKLHDQPNKDFYIQLMEVAAYCKILVLGDYTQQDILGLCKTCTEVLYKMRTGIVIATPE